MDKYVNRRRQENRPLVLALILVVVITFLTSACRKEANYNSEMVSEERQLANAENAIVSHNSEGKGNYSFFDATDSYVYFSYSEQSAQVDAYNYLGEYQFTILLSYRENGSVTIRCHENRLYISSKYKNVFVFSDEQLLESYSEEEAKNKGYTSSWFQKRSIPIQMKFTRIHRQRETGTDAICIPSVILSRSLLRYLIIVVVLFCFVLKLIAKKRPKKTGDGSLS